jgi:thermitase
MERMWKLVTVVLVLGLLVSMVGVIAPLSTANAQGMDPSLERILVKFKPGTPWNDIAQVHNRVGGKVESIIPEIGVHVVTVPHGQGATKSAAYRMQKGVRCAEMDGVAQVADVPNDQYFGEQWGMTKVQAPESWDITQGSPEISIAILDTGIDMDHPDLAAKIVSDVNFSDSPTSDYNGHSHGTHVAGIAAAISNNSIGVAGLGHDCSLMNVKVLGDDGYGYYSWIAEGIIWAADNGADVINLSVGGDSPSEVLKDAVDYAWSKGAVIVAGAGNNGSSSPFYPAYYTNCIAVGATDTSDNIPSWSNHGNWVDVAAPGLSIYSTMPGGQYYYKHGTSMACPHVAGLAGLLFSTTMDANGNGMLNDEVRSTIEVTCDNLGIDVAYGRINAYRAVQGVEPQPTGQIAGVITDATTGNIISGVTVSDGTRSATTDSGGYYLITDVPAGSYTVTASASGYEASSRSGVVVTSGNQASVHFSLTAEPSTPDNTMWVESITFIPSRKHLSVTVKVINPDPVRKAEVGLELLMDGALISVFSGATNPAGEVSFSWRHATNGGYTALITMLSHKQYIWDQSESAISGAYTLSR